ncbi:threonine aldolase family protein [Marasmitruncus massiliensis]|uniref:threonine aldolase family protein n=1 Tax=Marasmitruncus massiliensis TaxID=1944642 RepID=UPI000C7E3706|nr:low specificity L-threonine aldolase [Marasmitruncus massiliensis]
MTRFQCDYSEGAHPSILKKLTETNLEQTSGYGEDPYCSKAAALIREKCGRQDIDVHFLVGGTQTNLTVLAAALRSHQGVITADSGHINTHESGAIEATGHKLLALPGTDGKLTAEQIQDACDGHFGDATHEHMVQPKLVYLSFPTEVGTIYSRTELAAISETCRKNRLFLYVDGARMGYGLCAGGNDLRLPDFAQLCDAFYIGGTKIGALFGEALVLCNDALKEDFRYIIKQKGGLLAKGRLLGLQFLALFENDLYFELANHANKMAALIREACVKKGYTFLTPSPTNQQFPIMPDSVLKKLGERYEYSFWQKIDDRHSAVRFCTSWATNEADVRRLAAEIENS